MQDLAKKDKNQVLKNLKKTKESAFKMLKSLSLPLKDYLQKAYTLIILKRARNNNPICKSAAQTLRKPLCISPDSALTKL